MPRSSPPPQRVVGGELLPPIPTLTDSHFSQSLERGLAILECFTPERPRRGIADLAEELGMSRSTMHRYVLTLTALGYLRQVERRKYTITLGVTTLGMSAMASTSLREQARSELEDLHRRTGFTVSLAVLDGPEVLLVDRLRGARRGQQLIDLDQDPGSMLPAHCTAAGKLLLAHLPKRELRHTLGEIKLGRRTQRTIASKTSLRDELGRIRGESLAAAEEELAEGLYSIAAPIRNESSEVMAAAGIDAHRSMIPLGDLVGALGPHLISAADRVSARLGFRRDDERASVGVL